MIDQAVLSQMQRQLLEEPDGGQTWPSLLWTRDEVIHLLTQRQNRMLKETLLLVSLASPSLTVNIGDHRIALPADCIRVVTAVWRGNDGTVKELSRLDSFEADHALPTWELTNATYPIGYMEFDALQAQIQIAPAPSVAGVIELLYVACGAALTGNGVSLAVPDEVEPGLRYGTLADALGKDGRGQDLERAKYCEDRYQLGNEAIRLILKGWA